MSESRTKFVITLEDSLSPEDIEQLEDQLKEAIVEQPPQPHAKIRSTQTGNELTVNPPKKSVDETSEVNTK